VKPAVPPTDSPAAPSLALAELRRGDVAVVTSLRESASLDAGRQSDESLVARLRDLGFVPGARCEVVARMWLGGDPIAVRIGGSTFALRRAEAAAVQVQRAPAQVAGRESLTPPGTSAAAA
jgi:ferrous iron transport protein A